MFEKKIKKNAHMKYLFFIKHFINITNSSTRMFDSLYLIKKIMNLCLWFDVKHKKPLRDDVLRTTKKSKSIDDKQFFSKVEKANIYNHIIDCIETCFISGEFQFFLKKLLLEDYIIADCVRSNQNKPEIIELKSTVFKNEKIQWINGNDKKVLLPIHELWKSGSRSCELESSIVNSYMNLLSAYFHKKISFLSSDMTHDLKKWFTHFQKDQASLQTIDSRNYMMAYIHSIDMQNKKYVFYPFCDNGHWILVVFDLQLQSMYCINPLIERPISIKQTNNVLYLFKTQFIDNPHKNFKKGKQVEVWCMDYPLLKNNCPFSQVSTQRNAIDCGVLVCYYMRCLTIGRMNELNKFYETWESSYLFRNHMLKELNCKMLLEK